MRALARPLGCLLPMLALLPGTASAGAYSAKAIEARVVDARTGQPLEGVNVVAHWQLEYGLEGGSAYQLQVLETVTDANGRFAFPAWGPLEVPGELPREARLKDADPGIVLLEPGYDLRYESSKSDRRLRTTFAGHGPSVREWYANGDELRLTRLEDLTPEALAFRGLGRRTPEQLRAATLASARDRLEAIASNPPCTWRRMPRALASVGGELYERLKAVCLQAGRDKP